MAAALLMKAIGLKEQGLAVNLINLGADVYAKDNKGNTVFWYIEQHMLNFLPKFKELIAA